MTAISYTVLVTTTFDFLHHPRCLRVNRCLRIAWHQCLSRGFDESFLAGIDSLMPVLACILCRRFTFCRELAIPDRERLRMFLGPCRDSGSHLSGGTHPSLSWTLELLGTSDPDPWGFVGLWRHRMVRRYFGSMSRKVHLLLSTELGGKPSPARAGTRATDVPLAKQFQRGKELQKSRVQFPTTRITTLVLRS